MSNIPRDPRQLARDILSGKVKIEDLQRERMRAAGGNPGAGQVPAKIPLPRMAQPTQQRPAVRLENPSQRAPTQRVPDQRTAQPRQPAPPPRVPVRAAPPRMPPPARPSFPPPLARPAARPVDRNAAPPRGEMKAYDLPNILETAAQVSAGAKKELDLNRLMRSHRAVRQGIMMAEILGKPIALRDE